MSILAKITLPWPPSVNHYWKIGQRKIEKANRKIIRVGCVILTDRGKEYRDQVAIAVHKQCGGKPRIRGTLRVTIGANPPDRQVRDLDNLNKAILDGLMHAGLYVDDGQIDDLRIVRLPVVENGRIRVVVEPLLSELPLFDRGGTREEVGRTIADIFEGPDGLGSNSEPVF